MVSFTFCGPRMEFSLKLLIEERFSPSYSRISAGYSVCGVLVLCRYRATARITTMNSTANVRIEFLENFILSIQLDSRKSSFIFLLKNHGGNGFLRCRAEL